MGAVFSYIFNVFYGREQITLVMLGLNGAGKTTILLRLKTGETVPTMASSGLQIEKIEHNNIDYIIFDIGYGRCWDARIAKMMWNHIFGTIQKKPYGLMLVVDGTDRDHVDEACEFFNFFLDYKDVRKNPILVLVNKNDLPNAMTVSEVTDKLGLANMNKMTWYAQATSGTNGSGLYEGLDWLADELKRRN